MFLIVRVGDHPLDNIAKFGYKQTTCSGARIISSSSLNDSAIHDRFKPVLLGGWFQFYEEI
jgi:hypothetical protein